MSGADALRDAARRAAEAPDAVQPDWSRSQRAEVMLGGPQWSLKTPLVPAEPPASQRAIELPPKAHFFEDPRGMAISAASARAVIGYIVGDPKPEGQTRVVLCDLARGRTIWSKTVPGQWVVLSIDTSGKRVLVRGQDVFHDQAHLVELWQVDDDTLDRQAQWTAYDHEKERQRDVVWGAFLANGRFATLNRNGSLAVWNDKTLQPEWSLDIAAGCVPSISDDGRYLAVATEHDLSILDTTQAKVVASQTPRERPRAALAFDSSGTRLAGIVGNRLCVWSMSDGQVEREIDLLSGFGLEKLQWASDGHVLVNDQRLVDVEHGLTLCEYQGAKIARVARGICWFVLDQGTDRAGGLIGVAIPQRELLESLASAMKEPDFVLLKPGVKVRIDTSGIPDAGQREKIRLSLAKALEAVGCSEAADAPLSLVAAMKTGKNREVTYSGFGLGFGQSGMIQEYLGSVTFMYQGKKVWTTGNSNVPFSLERERNESVAAALKRYEKPDYEFFHHVELPKQLIRPQSDGRQSFGVSRVTTMGLR